MFKTKNVILAALVAFGGICTSGNELPILAQTLEKAPVQEPKPESNTKGFKHKNKKHGKKHFGTEKGHSRKGSRRKSFQIQQPRPGF